MELKIGTEFFLGCLFLWNLFTLRFGQAIICATLYEILERV